MFKYYFAWPFSIICTPQASQATIGRTIIQFWSSFETERIIFKTLIILYLARKVIISSAPTKFLIRRPRNMEEIIPSWTQKMTNLGLENEPLEVCSMTLMFDPDKVARNEPAFCSTFSFYEWKLLQEPTKVVHEREKKKKLSEIQILLAISTKFKAQGSSKVHRISCPPAFFNDRYSCSSIAHILLSMYPKRTCILAS